MMVVVFFGSVLAKYGYFPNEKQKVRVISTILRREAAQLTMIYKIVAIQA